MNSFLLYGSMSAEDKDQAYKDKDLALKEENNKTNKGIWDTLKEILSYLNPFSENFFVIKMMEHIGELIKSLFLPSDEFFVEWVKELNDWLSDRLGALYYPADIVVQFLERISTLNESGSAVIRWDSFHFMGAEVIKGGSYDLNSLLRTEALNNIHSIYLVVVDVILYLGLIVLAKNSFTDIFGGKYDDFSDIASQGFEADADYRRYSKYEDNRIRYRREHGGGKR